ncbi:hypothetical protein GYMLUDRAFT_251875 [Collybiopsis luxurians FD-317 M1]|uniref:Uncharacterized protein n=1 Tax=Collybiopsis luxurians FD-317 M1 TaxID=944289 RepID=A0A0D0BBB5_9AGAR|nr:hypothetical protein GYMLUDRAFT_251875 [Collybiopsis luxurians FD-317 M1]
MTPIAQLQSVLEALAKNRRMAARDGLSAAALAELNTHAVAMEDAESAELPSILPILPLPIPWSSLFDSKTNHNASSSSPDMSSTTLSLPSVVAVQSSASSSMVISTFLATETSPNPPRSTTHISPRKASPSTAATTDQHITIIAPRPSPEYSAELIPNPASTGSAVRSEGADIQPVEARLAYVQNLVAQIMVSVQRIESQIEHEDGITRERSEVPPPTYASE